MAKKEHPTHKTPGFAKEKQSFAKAKGDDVEI